MRLTSLFFCVVLLGPATMPSARGEDAREWHVVIHTHSWHSSHPQGLRWNENNWGLGVRHDVAPGWSWQTGVYRNSLERSSAYVLGDWLPLGGRAWSLGASGGLVAGGYSLPVIAVAGLVGRIQAEDFCVTLRLFPKPPRAVLAHDAHRSALVALEFSWAVK
jgi:hypothetical protein